MSVKAVVFDYIGVLVAMDAHVAETFFGSRVPISLRVLSRRWEEWSASEAAHLLTEGVAGVDMSRRFWMAFWGSLSAELDLPLDSRRDINAFHYLSLFQLHPEALPVLLDLRRRGLRVGVLSNSVLPKLEMPSSSPPLRDLIDVVSVPQGEGEAKPELKAYQAVARQLGVGTEQCLFFDNEPINVAGASRAGMRGYLVDRKRTDHSLAEGIVKDLSIISDLVAEERRA